MRIVPVRLMSTTRANSEGSYDNAGRVDQHSQRVEVRAHKNVDGACAPETFFYIADRGRCSDRFCG